MDTAQVGKQIEIALNELSEYFVPEAELTFIMRVPGEENTHMILSNDNLNELADLLKKQYQDDVERRQILNMGSRK